jgi:hypothetical protein
MVKRERVWNLESKVISSPSVCFHFSLLMGIGGSEVSPSLLALGAFAFSVSAV